MITADKTHSNIISLPHHHSIQYHNREAWAFAHKIRYQDLGPCLRALKERLDQNCPGEHFSTNFPMKIEVDSFVFTRHWPTMKMNLFFFNLGTLELFNTASSPFILSVSIFTVIIMPLEKTTTVKSSITDLMICTNSNGSLGMFLSLQVSLTVISSWIARFHCLLFGTPNFTSIARIFLIDWSSRTNAGFIRINERIDWRLTRWTDRSRRRMKI